MWIFNSRKNNTLSSDYWSQVADREFSAMDDEGQEQWGELR